MYRFLWLLLAVSLCLAARADGAFATVQWPGWLVETDEDYLSTQYPLANMLDGNPQTAWVFNKKLSYKPAPGDAYRHGQGTELRLRTDDGRAVAIDGIGIINGYAKSAETYRKNNRIRAITVDTRGFLPNGGAVTTLQLEDTPTLQKFALPPASIVRLSIAFTAVDPGPADDLCISELVLYHQGKPVHWGLTPIVVAHDSSHGECGGGGGPYFELRTRGNMPMASPEGKQIRFLAVARQPGSSTLLLGAEHRYYLYDLAKSKYLYQGPFSGTLDTLGWEDEDTAYLALSPRVFDTAHRSWYRLAIGRKITLRKTDLPAEKTPALREGARGPNYGA
ncbi:MAG: NADase-type glycan-binding domain-containing protein [Armatimonadota bacterium]